MKRVTEDISSETTTIQKRQRLIKQIKQENGASFILLVKIFLSPSREHKKKARTRKKTKKKKTPKPHFLLQVALAYPIPCHKGDVHYWKRRASKWKNTVQKHWNSTAALQTGHPERLPITATQTPLYVWLPKLLRNCFFADIVEIEFSPLRVRRLLAYSHPRRWKSCH